jgi:hypothetical protein
MKKAIKATLTIAGCVLAFSAFADTPVDEVFTCKLKEGKEFKDVRKANAEWVKHMNSAVNVGEIKSGTVTPVVGEGGGSFLFVDTYPSLDAWATAEEYQHSDAGQAAMKAISDALDAASDCTGNHLYRYNQD